MPRLLTALLLLFIVYAPAEAITRWETLELKRAANAKYKPAGWMSHYTVLVIKGKAFASTRGPVDGVPTVALWELNGGRWQFVYEHPANPPDPAEVRAWYAHYGFSTWQRNRLQSRWKVFPAG